MTIFLCAHCQTPFSKPVCHLDDLDRLQDKVGDNCYDPPSLVPAGFYVFSDEVLAVGKMWAATEQYAAFAPPQEFIFNWEDLIRHPTMINEEDVGCCGYTGGAGYNLFCSNGHVIGTEISDCCMVSYVHIPAINLVSVDSLNLPQL